MPTPKRRLFAAILGLAIVLALFLPRFLRHSVPPRYTVTDLGVLPGDTASGAFAVNSAGVAVGDSSGASEQACVFKNGTVIKLTSDSIARGINAQGEIAGETDLPEVHQAFLYNHGKMHTLGALPGFSQSEIAAINDKGEITGKAISFVPQLGTTHKHAFVYVQGKMTDLGTLPGTTESEAQSINALGQIVGTCSRSGGFLAYIPFLYDSSRKTMTALLMPAPNLGGAATHINDNGEVVGIVISHGPIYVHAALWSGGHFTDLGVLPGDMSSVAEGLNNHSEIVGQSHRNNSSSVSRFIERHAGSSNFWQRYWDRTTITERAFVCQNGRMQDLNTLIPKDVDWVLEDAESVNDRGQIVGYGLHHGQKRAFLLTPVR